MKRQERIVGFVRELWLWYALHKRSLPWRDLQGSDLSQRAYCITVSEFMLQQTQVPRVIPVYKAFLERFPTLNRLADAENAQVIRAWQGMGYNLRSLRLRDTARIVVEEYGGSFPHEMRALLAMKRAMVACASRSHMRNELSRSFIIARFVAMSSTASHKGCGICSVSVSSSSVSRIGM